jgi:hypothetical protein
MSSKWWPNGKLMVNKWSVQVELFKRKSQNCLLAPLFEKEGFYNATSKY